MLAPKRPVQRLLQSANDFESYGPIVIVPLEAPVIVTSIALLQLFSKYSVTPHAAAASFGHEPSAITATIRNLSIAFIFPNFGKVFIAIKINLADGRDKVIHAEISGGGWGLPNSYPIG